MKRIRLAVLGATGRGLAEAVGVEDDVDIIVGTFSKSLASIGGFAVGSEAMEVLRYGSRRIFLPPLLLRPALRPCARR